VWISENVFLISPQQRLPRVVDRVRRTAGERREDSVIFSVDFGAARGLSLPFCSTVTAISIFKDYAGAEESNKRALAWIERSLAPLLAGPATAIAGPVIVHTLA
jgi:hypothetical protein